MSRENVVIVRRALEAHSRMDADAIVALCDPQVEYQSRITPVDEVTYQGHDGIRRYITRLVEVFDWIDVEPLEVLEDQDRALVTHRFRARGRGGGVEVEQVFFVAIEFRDGKLVRWKVSGSKNEALEAARLSEQDAHVDS
jgi:ketosteroid isomerase-like protein